jgi:hypothetical protein
MIAVAASLGLAFAVLWGICGLLCVQHFGSWQAVYVAAAAPLIATQEGGELGRFSLCVTAIVLGLCIGALVKPQSGMLVGSAFVAILLYFGWSMFLIAVST